MARLLSVTPCPGAESASPPDLEQDFMLFIPEGSPRTAGDDGQRVGSQEGQPRELPAYLCGPSVFRPVVQTPVLSGDVVRELEGAVDGLGRGQVDELERIDEEQRKVWKKKIGNVMRALVDD